MRVDADRVRYVSYRQAHHSQHSGYDALTNYFGTVVGAAPISKRIIRNRMMYAIANGMPAYDWKSLGAEVGGALSLLTEHDRIFHVLYGENTYHYLGRLNNWHRNRLIATYHLPPSVFRSSVQIDWHIKQLSAVVCVARNQVEMFVPLLGRERVFFVPHGIDAEFFSPPLPSHQRESNTCLFVGNYLRDFPTLRGVIELVAYRRPNVQFVAVTAAENAERIGCHPNLTIKHGVAETELLQLYRTATLQVMPLLDATGNNAVLEGMACGLPAIVSDVGGVRDYVGPDSAVLVPGCDARRMADEVLDLLEDVDRRERMSESATKRAIQFAWPEVVKQLNMVYDSIM
jgi:glycosyltransferase involved in cell wall biosynthesis